MKHFYLAALAAVSLSTSVSAATISVASGQGSVITAPMTVSNATPGNNNGITYAFTEATSVALDAISAGAVDGGGLAVGTVVDSHMLLHNRSTGSSKITSFAEFSFSEQILGVISSTSGVIATHSLLGAVGTDYTINASATGYEGQDFYTLIGTNGISANSYITQPGDWIRVLTAPAAVPLPASILLSLAGLGGLAGLKRRRKSS